MNKLILLLAALFCLTGCETLDYKNYLNTHEKVSADSMKAQVARFNAIAAIATGKAIDVAKDDPAPQKELLAGNNNTVLGVAGIMALQSQGGNQQMAPMIAQPESLFDKGFKILKLTADIVLRRDENKNAKDIAVMQSNNALAGTKIQVESSTTLGLAQSNNTLQAAKNAGDTALGFGALINKPLVVEQPAPTIVQQPAPTIITQPAPIIVPAATPVIVKPEIVTPQIVNPVVIQQQVAIPSTP
jgi:hypothetical protein